MNATVKHLFGLSIFIVAALSSPAQAQSSQAEDEQAIRAARSRQNQALADKDLDRVATYWTSDVTIRRALGLPLAGADAARKALEPSSSAAPVIVYQRETTAVEVSTNWPLAYEEGRWSGYVDSVGTPVVIGGRYSAQWVKRNGQWLIRSEVFVAITCSGVGCKFQAAP
jgi:uncharacterized protein (TIGR02246 family)